MKLLLDTHIWLWSVLEPERLSRSVAAELESASNEVWLSPVSTWEALVLAHRGRLELEAEPVVWVRRVLRSLPFREAALTHEVAIESQKVSLSHADPADRFLAATAIVYGLTLVTADERLLEGEGFETLASR